MDRGITTVVNLSAASPDTHATTVDVLDWRRCLFVYLTRSRSLIVVIFERERERETLRIHMANKSNPTILQLE